GSADGGLCAELGPKKETLPLFGGQNHYRVRSFPDETVRSSFFFENKSNLSLPSFDYIVEQ
ncbi:hypothetical protein, partial [Acinetobacter baumannii]|uniref:hypothetical protein n=1 Tax=Acinetobacter baumannii TaxID=470 RepID=UPI001969CEFC